jgi:hypothetical protein
VRISPDLKRFDLARDGQSSIILMVVGEWYKRWIAFF